MQIHSTSDGWRGIIETEFTHEFIEALIEGFIQFLNDSRKPKNGIAVGYDTRRFSKEYAEKIANRLSIEGIPVILSEKPVPTPIIISYAIENGLTAALIITASHFPGDYNGIKFRFENGRPPSYEELMSIMNLTTAHLHNSRHGNNIKVEKESIITINYTDWFINFLVSHYGDLLELLKPQYPNKKIVVDAMHGTIGGIFPNLLSKLGWNVVEIRTNADYTFGGNRPDPIEPNCKLLIENVKKLNAILGIAFDGDGERVCFIDPVDGYIGPNEIPPLVLLSLFKHTNRMILKQSISPFVIKTLPVTHRVDQLAETKGFSIVEVPVGFRNLYFSMVDRNAMIGFGDDGSVIFPPHNNKDAILTSLCVLVLLNTSRLSSYLDDFARTKGQLYYFKDNISCGEKSNVHDLLSDFQKLCGKWDYTKMTVNETSVKTFLSNGWFLLRFAGTEEYIRIYAESSNKKDMENKLSNIYSLINQYIEVKAGHTPYTKLN